MLRCSLQDGDWELKKATLSNEFWDTSNIPQLGATEKAVHMNEATRRV